MMYRVVLLLLSTASAALAEKYTAGSTEVEVTTRFVDGNNSTESCVTYLSSIPEKYTTACFTSYYTDGGTFQRCKLEFDKDATKTCEVCAACTNFDEEIGYKLDCDSYIPSKSNTLDAGACTLLTDANIQMTLTDETTFVNTPFDFTVSDAPVTDDSDMNTNKTGTNGSTSDSSVPFIWSDVLFAVLPILSLVL